jgi:hypothetical protein
VTACGEIGVQLLSFVTQALLGNGWEQQDIEGTEGRDVKPEGIIFIVCW